MSGDFIPEGLGGLDVLRDQPLGFGQHHAYPLGHEFERGNRVCITDAAQEYLRGNIGIVAHFNAPALGDGNLKREGVAGADEPISTDESRLLPGCIKHDDVGVTGGANGGRDGSVLILIVEKINCIKDGPLSHLKSLNAQEKVFNPLVGGGKTHAGGVEFGLGFAAREIEGFVLFAVDADNLPRKVIQGGPKIVDSIAYYDPQFCKDTGVFQGDFKKWLSGTRIILNAESVQFLDYDALKSPLKLRSVDFCSFEL